MSVAGCLLMALLPWPSIGVRHHVEEASLRMSRSASGMCSDTTILADGCTRLRMYRKGTDTGDISLQEVADYFMANEEDMHSFTVSVLAGGSSKLTCSSLCNSSITFLEDSLGWRIPPRHGQACALWDNADETCADFVPVSFETMHKYAEAMELSSANTMQDSGVSTVSEVSETVRGDSLRYSEEQLALLIANIFSVFPFPPRKASSLAEGTPPTFGDEVTAEHRLVWKEIVPTSEAWVASALSAIPVSKRLLEVVMGDSDDGTVKAVRKVLLGMQQTLGEVVIRVGEEAKCPAETLAYVVQFHRKGVFVKSEVENDRFVIRICRKFWGDEFISDPTYRYGMLIHEASHHWGTDDAEYRGGSPYGLSQCLRMAMESPSDAQSNADNFMWLVYYLNRCSGPTPVQSATESPCTLRMEPVRSQNMTVKVKAHCYRSVQGATLKFIAPDGSYAFNSKKFGSLVKDEELTSSVLGCFQMEFGIEVRLFYQEGCNVWEASSVWNGQQAKAVAVMLHSMQNGGNPLLGKEPQPDQKPETPVIKLALPISTPRPQPTVLPLQPQAPVNPSSTPKPQPTVLPVPLQPKEPANKPQTPVNKPQPIVQPAEIDVTLHFGKVDVYLIYGEKRFKCCKHSQTAEAKLQDVTVASDVVPVRKFFVIEQFGCGALFGDHWHSYNNKDYSKKKPEIFDGTCKVKVTDFWRVTKVSERALRMGYEMKSGVEDDFTDEECRLAVPGSSKREVEVNSAFFAAMACRCNDDKVVAGGSAYCFAAVTNLRFFNPRKLSGKGCECSFTQ